MSQVVADRRVPRGWVGRWVIPSLLPAGFLAGWQAERATVDVETRGGRWFGLLGPATPRPGRTWCDILRRCFVPGSRRERAGRVPRGGGADVWLLMMACGGRGPGRETSEVATGEEVVGRWWSVRGLLPAIGAWMEQGSMRGCWSLVCVV